MGLGMKFQKRMQTEAAAKAQLEQLRQRDAAALADAAQGNAAFELLVTGLATDIKELSTVPQGEARRERKKKLLANYLPFVEEFLAGDANFQNPLLTWCLTWSCDIGDMATAQRLADAAIERYQVMPERFGSSVKLFWADAVREWADQEFSCERSVNPYFPDTFARVLEWPVHDIVKAKYHKLASRIAEKNGSMAEALEHARTARELAGDKAQVKTLIERLEKAVAAQREAERHTPAPESRQE